MWIKTDYDELINTDRLSYIRYDRISNTTIGWADGNRLIISNSNAVPIIMNGLMRGSTIVEVKH